MLNLLPSTLAKELLPVGRAVPSGVDETADEDGDTIDVGSLVEETAVERVDPAAELDEGPNCAEAAPTADRMAREDKERILCYERVTRSEKVVKDVIDLDMTGIESIASYFIPSGRRLSFCRSLSEAFARTP